MFWGSEMSLGGVQRTPTEVCGSFSFGCAKRALGSRLAGDADFSCRGGDIASTSAVHIFTVFSQPKGSQRQREVTQVQRGQSSMLTQSLAMPSNP
ncbi:hypothetical protein QG37_04845 [Candidozyma auris]|nr:hypothetical protein QG37_04845 [[Candida] auris]